MALVFAMETYSIFAFQNKSQVEVIETASDCLPEI